MLLKNILYLTAIVSAAPQMPSDQPCRHHVIETGDTCWGLSQKYRVNVDQIIKWNQKTPNWRGCDFLVPGMKVCVSPGTPPVASHNKAATTSGIVAMFNIKDPIKYLLTVCIP
jgi:hypothetical protein